MAKLGDWVRDNKNGYTGRVCAKHFYFGDSGNSQAWLDAQEVPFTKEDLNKNWYSILCLGGGSISTCETYIEVIEPQGNLDNPFESFYFGDK